MKSAGLAFTPPANFPYWNSTPLEQINDGCVAPCSAIVQDLPLLQRLKKMTDFLPSPNWVARLAYHTIRCWSCRSSFPERCIDSSWYFLSNMNCRHIRQAQRTILRSSGFEMCWRNTRYNVCQCERAFVCVCWKRPSDKQISHTSNVWQWRRCECTAMNK